MSTVMRSKQYPLILIASDTTFLNFNTHSACTGLGEIGSSHHKGFVTHSALALSPDGLPLGLLHQKSWVREANTLSPAEKKALPYKEKESYKWLKALRDCEEALGTQQKALLVQDREGDLFEFFSADRQSNVGLLIRAAQPRRVLIANAEQGKPTTLFKAMELAPVLGSHTIEVPTRPDRKARSVNLTLQVQELEILPPLRIAGEKPSPVKVWALRAKEESASVKAAERIEWVLLSTEPIQNYQESVLTLNYYKQRWLIERFHFALKSGCQFEKLQLDSFETLEKAMSFYSIIAWRLLHVTYLARVSPQLTREEVISDTEKMVLERLYRKKIATVLEALLAVAKLAGFVSVPSAPMPGVKVLWRGFRKLHDMTIGFRLNHIKDP